MLISCCSAEQLLMRSSNVGLLRAITQGGLCLKDTWELDMRSCLPCFCFFCCHFTVSLTFYHLYMSFSLLSSCPTLGSAVYCALLERFATRPKPIPLWQLLFKTPGLHSLVVLFLPARGKYLFVFLIVLKPFVLC